MRVAFLICGLIAATLYAGFEPTTARGNGAWCARTNTGAGRVQENCGFRQFAENTAASVRPVVALAHALVQLEHAKQ